MVPQPTVQVLRIACNEETRNPQHKIQPYVYYNVKPDHAVFTDGEVSPVSELLGVPLNVLMLRPSLKRGDEPRPTSWNQKAIWKNPLVGPQYYGNDTAATLMMDIKTGATPRQWSDDVGCVLIARKDGKDLDQAHVEKLLSIIMEQRARWVAQGDLPSKSK